MKIFDAMRAANDDKANVPLWPNGVSGTTKSLMLGQILLTSRTIANADPKRVLDIADKSRVGKPFINYATDSATGTPAPPYPNDWSYGPQNHTFSMVCLDIENDVQDWSPATMDALFAPIATKYPVCMCAQEQIHVDDDGPLKDPLWPKGVRIDLTAEYIAAKTWADENPWTRYLSYIETGLYLNDPKNDDAIMTLARNRIRLAKSVYPDKQLIFTTWGTREAPGTGQLHTGLCADLVKLWTDERADAVQVWGYPNENINLRAALGIG